MLYKAWERFKYMLWLCHRHGLQRWMIVQAFYNGSTIDAATGGTLVNKTEDKPII